MAGAGGLRGRGFLEGGLSAWQAGGRPVQRVAKVDAAKFGELSDSDSILVLDG